MPTDPREPDRAVPEQSDPDVPEQADPASEGAVRPPRGNRPRSDPPTGRGPATDEEPGPDATGDPAPSEAEYTAELQELEDRWRRALADLDNLRKRHARELERERTLERSRTAAGFLPVLDNLELALTHAGATPARSWTASGRSATRR
ncbi:Protein GrpE [Streptomyces alboniger]